MAKIKLSSVGITNISGKAGGSIYSRNRGGAYVKNFAVPTNPNTTFQQNVRNIFGGIAQAWRALTEEQRSSFNALAPLYTARDVFGDGLTYTGSQLHQKLNGNLMLNGQDPITTALEPQGTPPMISINGVSSLAVDNTYALSYALDYNIGEFSMADFVVVVSAAAPSSATRTYQQNRFRFVRSNVLATSGVSQGIGNYVDRFYSPLEGQVVNLKLQLLNLKTGELSAPLTEAVVTTQAV